MSRYTLFIKLEEGLDKDIVEYYTNYKSSHSDDSGFDLPAKTDYKIYTTKPEIGDVKSTGIKFGISCCMKENESSRCVGYYLCP